MRNEADDFDREALAAGLKPNHHGTPKFEFVKTKRVTKRSRAFMIGAAAVTLVSTWTFTYDAATRVVQTGVHAQAVEFVRDGKKDVIPATTWVFLTSGTTSWTVPSDWNSLSNTIHCIGPGAAGGGTTVSALRAGGGGGAYSGSSNVQLVPGASITVSIGAGTTGGSGAGPDAGDTYFNGANLAGSTVGAEGGNGGSGGSAGSGGQASNGTGTSKFNGGPGGGSGGGLSGGGGGAAGPSGAGGTATTTGGTANNGLVAAATAGTTFNGTHGPGGGATGVAAPSGGAAGANYGGAGSGAATATAITRSGGNGANGLIAIQYEPLQVGHGYIIE
jgi:hypothetical protein